MARKKKDGGTVFADRPSAGGPVLLKEALPTLPEPVAPTADAAGRDAGDDARRTGPQGEPAGGPADGDGQPPRQWANPYRATFTSAAGGFEVGEDRRFKQVVFRFADRPEPDVLARLKEAGYTYRAAERSWTVPASAAAREFAHGLAGELHLRAGGAAAEPSR